LSNFYNYDFDNYKGNIDKRTLARNMVDYEVGKTILDIAYNVRKKESISQIFLKI
jgi:DNA (cytosine-5)-methyltransferase 1